MHRGENDEVNALTATIDSFSLSLSFSSPTCPFTSIYTRFLFAIECEGHAFQHIQFNLIECPFWRTFFLLLRVSLKGTTFNK